jgi:hypothetical protein
MNRLRFRIARLFATLGVVVLLWACNAPFIPVPPPTMISFTSTTLTDTTGTQKTYWITHGGPDANAASARFFVYNEDNQAGVITTAASDGSFTTTPMDGAPGNRVLIYYQPPGGDQSPATCRVITEGVADAPSCPQQ